ncbi:MAG: hypothetical protein COC01_08780 [Bacteroidetes bacterium]|nr:hypothetical protein [Bacteroidia bacterium]PCH66181.1 MAG: hypothetical protein COC01_08780 [Bacteroidota bacterium]
MENILITGGLYLSYMFLAVAALGAVAFPIIQMAKNPKGARSSIIGVVAILIIFGISYIMASDEPISKFEANYKMVGGAIISMYILGIGAIGSIVYVEVSKMFK